MAQHADKLTEGTKELLKRYPTMRVDVYPTHRTVALPEARARQHRQERDRRQERRTAGSASRTCSPGFPFPIPKTGYEAMWNHLVRFTRLGYDGQKYDNWNVDSAGVPTLATTGDASSEYPMYDPKRPDTVPRRPIPTGKIKLLYTGPARRAGEALLVIDSVNPLAGAPRLAVPARPAPRQAGAGPRLRHAEPRHRRRVDLRRHFVFNGAMDRFDFKLVGKKEMYVPYNGYRLTYAKTADDTRQAEPPQPRLHALGAAPRVGGRGDAEAGQAPHLQQAHLLPRRGQLGGAGLRRVRRRGQLYRSSFAYMTSSYDVPAP